MCQSVEARRERMKRHYQNNKAAKLAANRKWWEANRDRHRALVKARNMRISPDQKRRDHLKNRYRMTLENEHVLLLKQGNSCAICREPLDLGASKNRQIDHDHDTGAVRGILCRLCNMGIGSFKDSLASLESAIAYIKAARDRQAAGVLVWEDK